MKKLIDKFDTPIHHEQIRALYQQSPFVLFSVLAVTLIVAIFFWEQVDHRLIVLKMANIVQMKAAFVLHQDKCFQDFRGLKTTITFRLRKVPVNAFSETQ